MPNPPQPFDVVLLGVGHTNAHIVEMWRKHPLPQARLTCVSDFADATYSGMLPGTLAGQYEPDTMRIDLRRLCEAAGAKLIIGAMTGLDVARRELHFAEHPPLRFDALSIGIGSRPTAVPGDDTRVVRIKPMQTFIERLDAQLDRLSLESPARIVVVGGGAGGFEITCCLPRHLEQSFPDMQYEITVVDHNTEILSGMPRRTQQLARNELEQKGVRLQTGSELVEVSAAGELRFADDRTLSADVILWATSARAPAALELFLLEKDDRGFLLTDKMLQSTTDESIFAVGDTGTCAEYHAAKAGVHAVRQGPVLWENLQRLRAGKPLIEWQPQSTFLTLLNTGDGRAILTYRGWSFHARWCWWLKDQIDRRFVARYQ